MTVAASRPIAAPEPRAALRDSLIVTLGGQVERMLGILTSLVLRWGLDPARLGVYTGLRVGLDQTNRSSLGIGLGAVQRIPILLAQGREDEAKRVADVAFTATSLAGLLYAVGLAVWALVMATSRAADPLAREWTLGLLAVAGLTLLQRHLSFRVALLRAHRQFTLATELDVLEAVASAALIALGLALAGFWGLLGALGLIFAAKIAYLDARGPVRPAWAWDTGLVVELLREGLPIFAATAAFAGVLNLDRLLILWLVPDGARAAGLYSVALLGTSWTLDLAGRVATVLYPHFQTTLGRTGDRHAVAQQAARAAEALAPVLAAVTALACLVGPAALGLLLPRYAEGLPALRPLAPGMLLLGLSWPARQMLVAIGRPYRLGAATLAGLVVAAGAAGFGAMQAGIVGVAWGMSTGGLAVFLTTSAVALVPTLGARAWGRHLLSIAAAILTAGLLPGLLRLTHRAAP